MNLPHTLDSEFKRVAKVEGKSMERLVNEVAALTGKSPRQLYNFRSGKWDIPAGLFPVLCRRFGSLTLADALREECCEETEVEVPEAYDLTYLVTKTVRDDLHHYEKFLAAFEDGVVSEREMVELRASGERVIGNVKKFEAIAQADLDRRTHFQKA
ncbi:MAG: hypothetical protein H0T60_12255 [Acidobacteria bacterium]|nr:hypothetical protein [Acidobacteriota bacterium]